MSTSSGKTYAIHIILIAMDPYDGSDKTDILEEDEVVGAKDEYDDYETAKADYDKLKRRYQA